MRVGTVYLVGAGPGDPGLLTVKGSECLKKADVVVYDRLSSPELLALAAPSAELVFMGKEPETPGGFQQQINASLVAAALQGKTVVRLKGGDPFVFGRGGEELDALREAGVPFEVVPGISSAIAVPAYAGIPVTHRGQSTSFTVVTGSEDPTKPEQVTNWEPLAQVSGTLVVLMGWQSLPNIIDTLIANGKDAKTPVAVIQWGTTPRQRSVSGTLKDIVAKGNNAGLTSPVITVIGAVAALRERMRWFDTGPLFGQRVLVTRSRQQASTLSEFLSAKGADPIELPTIQIEDLEDYAKLDAALEALPNYEWVVFSSTNAIDAVFNRLKVAGRDTRAFGKAKVCTIGPATARLLNKHGIIPDYMPSTYTTEAVVKGLTNSEIGGKRVLLPRANIATETLSEGLREAGAILDEVDAYRTSVPPNAADRARDLLRSGNIDAVTFTSSSTVMNLVSLLDGDVSLLEDVKVVSIGPITSTTALGLGVHVDVEASEHTVAGIVDALVDAQSIHQVEVRTHQRGVKHE